MKCVSSAAPGLHDYGALCGREVDLDRVALPARSGSVGLCDESQSPAGDVSDRGSPIEINNLGPTRPLMWQTHGRPFESEGGATFRVDDRFRASWSLLT
jgi:hypothetical protein